MRPARSRVPKRRCAALLLLLALLACVGGGRLRGATYAGEDPPFIAPQSASSESLAGSGEALSIAHRLLLIGDAGAPLPGDPTLALLGAWGDAHPERTTVLFLGDNSYPDGLRPSQRARGEGILRQQIDATRAAKMFVPGNHDWGFSPRARLQRGRLLEQQRFVEAQTRAGADFEPEDGCPGPVATLVAPGDGLVRGLTVIVVDFHWWLLPESDRPRCAGIDDTGAFVSRLDDVLATHAGENVVVAAHHPLRSGGPHGGLTRGFWTDLGAAIFSRLYGPLQDLWDPTYAQMIGAVSEVLGRHHPVAFAAGHDHSLRILDGGAAARLLVVSGAGSADRITGVIPIEGTLFAHAHPGFVVFDFSAMDAD